MSAVETAATFRRAAGLIRDGGLAQGLFVDDTAYCIIGALMTARHKLTNETTTGALSEGRLLATMLGKQFLCELVDWNDEAGRTADDVVTLLEQAAEKLEAEL